MMDKKQRSVRLKDKDLELFDFIAKFGFASVDQLHSYLGGSINSLKTRLSHLVNDGYLLNHRIFFSKPSVYTVTSKSNRTELGLVRNVNIRNYEHDIMVINIFLALRDRFTKYASEKMIRASRGVGVGKSGHIPDLVGYTAEGKSVAIELERTDKNLDRVKGIVVSYATQHEYDEVWVICCNQLIFNNFEKVGFADKIKLFHLKDIMAGNLAVYSSKSGEVPKELSNKESSVKVEGSAVEEVPEPEEKKGKFFGNFSF